MQVQETTVFTDYELDVIKNAFKHAVATTNASDLQIGELEEANRILKKPEWIALFITECHRLGVSDIDPENAWEHYGQQPADDAAHQISLAYC